MQEDTQPFQLLDALFEPIVIIDDKFKIIYYNHFFSTFTKASPRIIRNAQTIFKIINVEEKILQTLLATASANNQVALSQEMEIKLASDASEENLAPDRQVHASMKVIPLSTTRYILCFNVLSVEKGLHRKYREKLEELKRANGQIIQADKLATLGELSASIAHEINNPLAIAMGHGEILERVLENETIQERELVDNAYKNISEALQRIKTIVMNMKSFAHKSEEKKQYHDLISIIDKSMMLVDTPFRAAGIDLKFERPVDKFITLVNRIEMEQVIVNLLKNALDALREQSTISAAHIHGIVEIKLKKNKQDECLEILVIDNGPGIPEKIQGEIFSPFFTTKEISEGTGLGLSVSSKIVEGHHGKLQLTKSSNEGSIFTVQLPLIEVSSYVASVNALNASNDASRKKILVVDDEEKILNILSTFLEEVGHTMIGSTDPSEALEMMDKLEMDLIIT